MDLSSTVVSATIQEQLYQILRREVINREFATGEQLKEADLAKRFNVSRSPVREALHRLAGDGILTIVPNKGIFVRKFTEAYIIDVLEFRSMLEQRGLKHCMEEMTPKTREQLKAMRNTMETLVLEKDPNISRHAPIDTAFHTLIMDCNMNVFVSEVAEKISAINSMFRHISLQDPNRAIESQVQHIELIDNLLAKNQKSVFDIYLRHIEGTKKRVIGVYDLTQ